MGLCRAAFLLTGGLLLLSCCIAEEGGPDGDWQGGLRAFFDAIDADSDNQIEEDEARSYIEKHFGGAENFSTQDLQQAMTHMRENLDGSDKGQTISESEVEDHLRSLMQGAHVAEWVKHGLGLPQYVQAFRDNAVSVLDFPLLVNDGGATLRDELGVTSNLHRQQILRGIRRIILGMGQPPSAPQVLTCKPLSCKSTALTWKAPEKLGHPPMHKYKLERQLLATGAQQTGQGWVTADGDVDHDASSVVDAHAKAGIYRYRLTAWNAHSWSQYAISEPCSTAQARLPCADAATCRHLGRDCPEARKQEGVATNPSAMGEADPEPDVSQKNHRMRWFVTSWGSAVIVAITVLLRFHKTGQVLNRLLARPFVQQHFPGLTRWLARHNRLQQQPDAVQPNMTAGPRLLHSGSNRAFSSFKSDRSHTQEPVIEALAGRGLSSGNLSSAHPSALQGFVDSMRSASIAQDLSALGSRSLRHISSRASSAGLSSTGSEADAEQARQGSQTLSPSQGASRHPSRFSSKGSQLGGAVLEQHDSEAWREELEAMQSQGSSSSDDLPPTAAAHGDSGRCAFPGCHRQFARYRLLDIKRALQRHYCAMCQNVYCHWHTRISPHGAYGSCGVDSKCVCFKCFKLLSQDAQAQMEKVNKLKHRDLSKTPLGSNNGSSSQLLAGSSSRQSGSPHAPGHQLARQPSLAQQRWTRSVHAAKAVAKFKAAGEERRRSRESTDLVP